MTVISDTVDEYVEINEDTGQVFIKKPLEKFSETNIRLIVVVWIFVVLLLLLCKNWEKLIFLGRSQLLDRTTMVQTFNVSK